jgi:2-oxoglutarate ferredoxin oxidoreductase subunit gamma
MIHETTKILFAGEGGQGVQTIAEVLTSCAVNSALEATYIPYFGVEQRGAPSIAYVTISKENIYYPRFDEADVIIVMRERAIKDIKRFITPNTDVIFDSSTIPVKDIHKIATKLLGFPGSKYALTKFGAKAYNLLVLGVIGKHLGFETKDLWEIVYGKLKNKFKSKEVEENSKAALEFGAKIVLERGDYSKAEFKADLGDKIYRNKEREGIVKPSLCKGCLICVEKCPVAALAKGKDVGFFGANIPDLDIEKCITCGICRRFCPDGAIAVEKKHQ